MGQDIQSSISNLLIAQLNDVAYKAIRKAGVQKRLDERAIKNNEFFKVKCIILVQFIIISYFIAFGLQETQFVSNNTAISFCLLFSFLSWCQFS